MAIWTQAQTNKSIRQIKKNGTHSVLKGSGLYLRVKDNSKYFEGRLNFPFNKNGKKISVQVGIFEKEILRDEALTKWFEIKEWSKTNNKNPKLFHQENEERESEKTFKEVSDLS